MLTLSVVKISFCVGLLSDKSLFLPYAKGIFELTIIDEYN